MALTKLVIDGVTPLKLDDVLAVAHDPAIQVEIAESSPGLERLKRTAAYIDESVKVGQQYVTHEDLKVRRRHLIYGVSTGFGHNKNKALESLEAARQLQRNLIVSHAAGVGLNADPEDMNNYLEAPIVRALLLIRAAMFLQGYSGVRPELVQSQLALLNANVLPLIPKKGSVGSSGDLAPLAHLALVLIGEGWALVDGRPVPGKDALKHAGLSAYEPSYKEGIALTNGTTVTLAIALLAWDDARRLLLCADALASMTLEAVLGPTRAFEHFVHALRHHPGQILSAQNIRAMIGESQLINKSGEVQSLYSLRCAPQVHGAAHDTWKHVSEVLQRELNAVTDNPLLDPDLDINDTIDQGQLCAFNAFSAGNFHGEPIGFVMDFLAVAMAEIANISERRTQMLLDANFNDDLPQDLIPNHGLNSGFMILQYSAAALASENKVLAHPSSVDSIPTSSNAEDHVAMSPYASRKARTIISNGFSVLGIELLAATQALCYRTGRLAWPADIQDPQTFKEADLGVGTRAAFVTALEGLGDNGREFEPFASDDRAPAPYARRARKILEEHFVDSIQALLPEFQTLSFS